MITILGSRVNKIGGGGGGYMNKDCLMNMRIFTLTMKKVFLIAQNIMRKVATITIWIANHLVLISCFISYEKRASWKLYYWRLIYLKLVGK